MCSAQAYFPFSEGHRHSLTEHASQLLLIKNSFFMFKVYNTKNNFPFFRGVGWAPRKGQGPQECSINWLRWLCTALVRYSSAPHSRQAPRPAQRGQAVVRCYVIWGTRSWQTLYPTPLQKAGGFLPGEAQVVGSWNVLGGFHLDTQELQLLPSTHQLFSSSCRSPAEDDWPSRAGTLG